VLTVAFTTLGCKVNQYETRRIAESFERRGFRVVPFEETANVYVVNTCSVTAVASSKSRQMMRRAKRTNPSAKLVVTGCEAQAAARAGRLVPEADLVVANPEKLETVTHFLRAFPEFAGQTAAPCTDAAIARVQRRTRAVVKVQDGCNIFCSYCSIPYTRPVLESRPWHELVDEVEGLVAEGHREVVLTGVLIGDYGPLTGSGGPDLTGLCVKLADIRRLQRIRISSIEVTQVSDELIRLMREEPKMCPHLHIPLQSGSDRVLLDMGRPYTRDEYVARCSEAKARVRDLAITTDIMVGFPTEDEVALGETVGVVKTVGYLAAHVFRYSSRPGTPAEELGDPVPHEEKMRRSKMVADVTADSGRAYRTGFIGRDLRVLVESAQRAVGLLKGHSDNYLELEFPGPGELVGDLVTVRVLADGARGMTGQIVETVTPHNARRTNGRLHIL
jgi:threonylcarbamoyladenosine tRNA methylthiotransferase MtaB